MDRIVVEGGARLAGEVAASGSKNSTLALMAAALLADGETVTGCRGIDGLSPSPTLDKSTYGSGVKRTKQDYNKKPRPQQGACGSTILIRRLTLQFLAEEFVHCFGVGAALGL